MSYVSPELRRSIEDLVASLSEVPDEIALFDRITEVVNTVVAEAKAEAAQQFAAPTNCSICNSPAVGDRGLCAIHDMDEDSMGDGA